MKKKIAIRLIIGFLMGIASMFIVPAMINHTTVGGIIYSDSLLSRTGSPEAATLVTLLTMGLFGTLCFGGTLFYEIERWPLALATATHFLTMSLGYLIPNRVLCWELPPKLLLAIEGFMALGFFLIWLIMYLHYKFEVRKLNELIERNKASSS